MLWLLKNLQTTGAQGPGDASPVAAAEAKQTSRPGTDGKSVEGDCPGVNATARADAAGGSGVDHSGSVAPGAPAPAPPCAGAGAQSLSAQVYHVGDEAMLGNCECELDDMYDFSRFLPSGVAAADAAGGDHRLAGGWRAGKDHAPAAGGIAAKRTGEVEPEPQAACRPADARPEDEHAHGSGAQGCEASARPGAEAQQQWQKGGPAAAPQPAAPEASAGEEEQLMELARIVEQLTDAMEQAKEAEEAARRQAAAVAAQLDQERALRNTQEQALSDALQGRAADAEEATSLRALLADRDQCLQAERARHRELELRLHRIELESGLERALASKGRSFQFRHLEV
mmetsp:Transcript_82973/g.258079  ORF Transcript_82973/g.258079 Transcript_82973/m.258079 type:complete len:342 (-) Transcript_82973:249-1274(-)